MAATASLSERLFGQWLPGLHLLLLMVANTASLVLVGLVLAPWRSLRQRGGDRSAALLLWSVLVAVMVAVPMIAPTSVGGLCWGPRYYLSFVPLLFLTAVWPCGNERGWRRAVIAAACVGAALWSASTNLAHGTAWLKYHQQERTWPMLQFVRQQPETFVVVNEQFTVQELASLIGEKTFFWVDKEGVIETVARTLRDRGAPGFLIVLAVWGPEQQAAVLAGGGATIQITSVPAHVDLLGLLGYFAIYRVAFAR